MSDIVGTSVIGIALDDSRIKRDLAAIDNRMKTILSKPRVMPITIIAQSKALRGMGKTSPAFGPSAVGGMGKISAGGGGGGRQGAGMLQQLGALMGMDLGGIKGMAPYVRMGKGGMYGGLSGIDLIGSMKGMMGGGRGKAAAGPKTASESGDWARWLSSGKGTTGKMVGGGSDVMYTGGKMGQAAIAGGKGSGVVPAATKAGAGIAAGVATAGVALAIIGTYMVMKKLYKVMSETSGFKFLKTIFQDVVGTFLGVILMMGVLWNTITGNLIGLFAPVFGPFIIALNWFINFFAEKSLAERFSEVWVAFEEDVKRISTLFYGAIKSAATYTYDSVVGAADYITTGVETAIDAVVLTLAEGALTVYDWFVDAGDYVKTKVGDAADYVGEKWGAIGTWLQENIITPLKEFNFGDDILTPIKNVFSSIATTLYNAFITYFINPIANVFSSLINYVIGWANKIPGINISKMGNVEFPESDGVFS